MERAGARWRGIPDRARGSANVRASAPGQREGWTTERTLAGRTLTGVREARRLRAERLQTRRRAELVGDLLERRREELELEEREIVAH